MKLQAVVVLYKQKIAESKSIRSLFDRIQSRNLDIDLLIYDNSPSPQSCEHAITTLISVIYTHDPTNGGLVPAYNQGLVLAKESGTDWLLLLDQDTILTDRYFETLHGAIREHGADARIAAYAPHIIVRGKCVAPSWFFLGVHRHVKISWHGIATKPVIGINSATVVRVSYVGSIGGFDERFPLNFTDYWLYREIYRSGKMVIVLDCGLDHELSAANRDTFRPVPLYRDVLYHEGLFYRSSQSRIVVIVFWSRLMLRVLKHYVVFKDKGYSRTTFSYIWRELIARPR
ncbi:MAG: glycosyltransferase [Edaphobacter sp.]